MEAPVTKTKSVDTIPLHKKSKSKHHDQLETKQPATATATSDSQQQPQSIDPKSLRLVSPAELAQHSGLAVGSSWTSIDGLVYDITRFSGSHPGGPVIRYAAGRDSTALFESYHPTKSMAIARKLLARPASGCTLVGRLEGAPKPPDSTFLTTVKQRCEAHLKQQGIDRHYKQTLGCIEALLTILTYGIATYYTSVHGSVIAAIVLGVCTARLGFVMHTGNHCAASGKVMVNRFLGHCMDLIGSSNLIWGWEHQVAHHGVSQVLSEQKQVNQATGGSQRIDSISIQIDRYQN